MCANPKFGYVTTAPPWKGEKKSRVICESTAKRSCQFIKISEFAVQEGRENLPLALLPLGLPSMRVTKFALRFYTPSLPSYPTMIQLLLIALPHYCPTFMALPHYHPIPAGRHPLPPTSRITAVDARAVRDVSRSLMEKESLLQVRRRCTRRTVARLPAGQVEGWRVTRISEVRPLGS